MDITAFCTTSKVLVVAGKGGVGKTTASAALAKMAARQGLSVLLIELEGRPALTAAFGTSGPLAYDEAELLNHGPGSVRGRWITPDEALLEYLADHGFRRVSKRLVSAGIIDVVATAIPGIRDVLVLGKVKQLERTDAADLIIVDAPATGHAVTFLTSASGLLDAARGGPLRAQAAEVLELLNDPARCRVVLVTLPEEMPVSETIEAAYQLEDQAGVQLGPVIVNCVDIAPPDLSILAAEAAIQSGIQVTEIDLATLDAARHFTLRRHSLHLDQMDRLARELPLPQLHMPELVGATIGPDQLNLLATSLERSVATLGEEVVG